MGSDLELERLNELFPTGKLYQGTIFLGYYKTRGYIPVGEPFLLVRWKRDDLNQWFNHDIICQIIHKDRTGWLRGDLQSFCNWLKPLQSEKEEEGINP